MRCVFWFSTFGILLTATPILFTNLHKGYYKKRKHLMLFTQNFSLAPCNPLSHEGFWASLSLRFLGLGFNIKNTNRKNFKCCGPWPFLLLMASLNACWDDPSSIASLVILMYFWFSSQTSPGYNKYANLSRLSFSISHWDCELSKKKRTLSQRG